SSARPPRASTPSRAAPSPRKDSSTTTSSSSNMCTSLPPSADTDDGIGARGEDAGDSPRTPVGLLRVAGVAPHPRVAPDPSRGMCRGVVAATEHHARGPSEAPSREEQDDEEEYRRLQIGRAHV